MARRLVWSLTAATDFEEAADWLHHQSSQVAKKFVQKVIDRIEILLEFPHSGRIVPEFEDSGLREIVVMGYRITVLADTVNIKAIVHAARDLYALWERERA